MREMGAFIESYLRLLCHSPIGEVWLFIYWAGVKKNAKSIHSIGESFE